MVIARHTRGSGAPRDWTVKPMATLDTKDREDLRSTQFAYVDSKGGEHLPVHDESHARNAIARFNQTEFESEAAKERARRKILKAAERFGIDVADDSNVSRRTTSLRAASTKRGPRGGRKDR
jgi:hypothetical protein